MPKQLSTTLQRTVNAVNSREPVVVLLEIDHPDLVVPARVANYSDNIVSNGNTFIALSFRFSLPSDLEQGLPSAQISMDNVGRPPEGNSIAEWLELAGGGKGATVRMMGVLPSDPDTLEFDMTLSLSNVTVNIMDILNMPAVTYTYRPDSAPGLW